MWCSSRKNRPEYITLSKDVFGDADLKLEAKVKVLYSKVDEDGKDVMDNRDGKENIIEQYVTFCKVLNEQEKVHGRTRKAVEETIRTCMDREVLKEYLAKEREEVVDIMSALFDEEIILRNHIMSQRREAIKDTKVVDIKNMMEALKLTAEQAMDVLKIPRTEQSEYMALL